MGREPLRRGFGSGGGGGYQSPAFTTFGIDSQPSPIEVGDLSLANPTFYWTTSHSPNVQPNTIDIDDVTGATNIATGLANDLPQTYAATYAAIQKLVATYNRFRISGQNTHALAFSRTYDIVWQWRRYYGESGVTPLNQTQIKALRVSGLSAGFAGVYSFLAADQEYKYIAYAAALGTATVFRDADTGFPVPTEAPYTVSVTNAFGATTLYNVHRTTNKLGGAINIAVS